MFVPGLPSPRRVVVIAGAIAVLASAMIPTLLLGVAQPAAAQPAETIGWSIENAGRDKNGSEVQLTINRRWGGNHSTWSNRRSIGELRGLNAAQVIGPTQPVRFELAREAGRLDCSGTAGHSSGSGSCSFTPDLGFSTFLEARGIGRPDRQQSYSLTMSGVGRDLVDALDKGGFARPTIDQLTAMGIHGATADYVRALSGLGYHLSADDLVSFKIHGVEPDYIRGFAAMGPSLRQISPSDLISLRIHGVKPEFVRELAAIGPEFRSVTADGLVAMAIHGVRPDLARAFVTYEGGRLNSDDLVAMAIHGVTASYIEQLAALGYRNFTADDLVSISIHGVTPGFVRSLQRVGVTRVSAAQLVRLRISGFDPDER
jgi:hypothetical protein